MDARAQIAKAIAAAGSQPKLGERAGISQQHISKLLNGQRKVTAEIALALEKATNGVVGRSE